MEYGIQRRSIYLTPPMGDDLDYLVDAFEEEDVWSMFGYDGPARERILSLERERTIVRGIIRRVEDDARIGFSALFPPPEMFGLEARLGKWEYGVAILDPRDRNGWAAIQASDAMTHYCVDHLGLVDWWWRIRADNRPSKAIARRMGYRSLGAWSTGRHTFSFYRMTQAVWDRRLGRIRRAEVTHPSPGGCPFLVLPGPDYRPERAFLTQGGG